MIQIYFNIITFIRGYFISILSEYNYKTEPVRSQKRSLWLVYGTLSLINNFCKFWHFTVAIQCELHPYRSDLFNMFQRLANILQKYHKCPSLCGVSVLTRANVHIVQITSCILWLNIITVCWYCFDLSIPTKAGIFNTTEFRHDANI